MSNCERKIPVNERTVWSYAKVMDVSGPTALLRTYLEQTDVRRYITNIGLPIINAACDVGAGYGRLSVVLTEFASSVVAFEREPALVAEARRLLPDVDVRQVTSLSSLPSESSVFQFVMTFTVLQHLDSEELSG